MGSECFYDVCLKSFEALYDIENQNSRLVYPQKPEITTYGVDKKWLESLAIPTRLATIVEIANPFKSEVDYKINDIVIFPATDGRLQVWDSPDGMTQPTEYIFVVDLNGHFIYAQKMVEQPESQSESTHESSEDSIPLGNVAGALIEEPNSNDKRSWLQQLVVGGMYAVLFCFVLKENITNSGSTS